MVSQFVSAQFGANGRVPRTITLQLNRPNYRLISWQITLIGKLVKTVNDNSYLKLLTLQVRTSKKESFGREDGQT